MFLSEIPVENFFLMNRNWIFKHWIKLFIIFLLLTLSPFLFLNTKVPHQQSITTKATQSTTSDLEKCANFKCSHDKTCRTSTKTCCAWLLKNSLRFLDQFFREHNLSYAIVYGTLLGAVRNGTIIPWTRDIDIAFFNKSYLFTKEIRDSLYQHGYHVLETIGLTRLCFHQNASEIVLPSSFPRQSNPVKAIYSIHAYVDLYVGKVKNYNTTYNATVYSVEFAGTHLSPISFRTEVKIDENSYPTVDNVKEHLVHFYGNQYNRDVIPRIP